MTPLDIEILLHCYCRADVFPRIDAPAVQDSIRSFLCNDVICHDGGKDRYRTTAKGKAWVDMLCATPEPVNVWIDPRFNQGGEV